MTLENAETNDDLELDTDLDEETIIDFGDTEGEGAQSSQEDESNSDESSTIKAIRTQLRQTQQELNQLKSKPIQQEALIVVGDKPTFEGCDFDPDKFQTELEAYHDRKSKADKQQTNALSKQQEVIATFNNQIKALGVKDFDTSKEVFNHSFSLDQKNAILTAADNMALIVYALGKQPAKVEMLMQISDPLKLAAAVAKIEKDIKVIKKSNAGKIEPDKVVKGNASNTTSGNSGVQKQLDKLRENARTGKGSMASVIAFKKANNLK